MATKELILKTESPGGNRDCYRKRVLSEKGLAQTGGGRGLGRFVKGDAALLKKAAASYQKGDISREEAAVRAKASIWRLRDYLRVNNITLPPEQS